MGKNIINKYLNMHYFLRELTDKGASKKWRYRFAGYTTIIFSVTGVITYVAVKLAKDYGMLIKSNGITPSVETAVKEADNAYLNWNDFAMKLPDNDDITTIIKLMGIDGPTMFSDDVSNNLVREETSNNVGEVLDEETITAETTPLITETQDNPNQPDITGGAIINQPIRNSGGPNNENVTPIDDVTTLVVNGDLATNVDEGGSVVLTTEDIGFTGATNEVYFEHINDNFMCFD